MASVPAGRIASAAGTPLGATLINCFVQPVGDSIAEPEDGFPGIYTALTEAAETMRRGGGVGYDFSRIRPKGAWVGSTDSHASGPGGELHAGSTAAAGRSSRPAAGAARRWACAATIPTSRSSSTPRTGDLRSFNISVGVTNEFMRAVEAGGEIEALVHKAEPGRKIKGRRWRDATASGSIAVRARALWDQIMRSTYDHAEAASCSSIASTGQQSRLLRDDHGDQSVCRRETGWPPSMD